MKKIDSDSLNSIQPKVATNINSSTRVFEKNNVLANPCLSTPSIEDAKPLPVTSSEVIQPPNAVRRNLTHLESA